MILVTGGTGLVGSHLLYHLIRKGEKVRAIHRPGSDLEQVRKVFGYYDSPSGETDAPSGAATAAGEQDVTITGDSGSEGSSALFGRIEWVPADMLDPFSVDDALKGVTRVFHCAAIVSFDPSERTRLIKNNIESTANLVNLCLEHGIARFCHVSSVSALGSRYDGEPVTEDDLWKPSPGKSAYSISKYHSEMEVWRGISEGLDAVIVNPSVILGPGNWKRGSAGFFTGVQKGLKYYTGGMTGFVDVRDVCLCMIRLMDSEFSGERFILNGEDLYYRDVFNMIADALGRPRPSRLASTTLVEAGWRLEWLRSKITFSKPLLTRETARSGRGIGRYSNKKIKEAIGHEFIPVGETVKWTTSFMKGETPSDGGL